MGLRNALGYTGLEGALEASERFANVGQGIRQDRLAEEERQKRLAQEAAAMEYAQARLAGNPQLAQAVTPQMGQQMMMQEAIGKMGAVSPEQMQAMGLDQNFQESFGQATMPQQKFGLDYLMAQQKQKAAEIAKQTSKSGKQQELIEKNLDKVVTRFNTHAEVKTLAEQLKAAGTVKSLLDVDGPIAGEQAKTQLARLAGEKGPLNEGDIKRVGGSNAMAQQAVRLKQKIVDGRSLTERDVKELRKIVKVFQEGAQARVKQIAEGMAVQGSKTFSGLKKDKITEAMALDFMFPEAEQTPADIDAAFKQAFSTLAPDEQDDIKGLLNPDGSNKKMLLNMIEQLKAQSANAGVK